MRLTKLLCSVLMLYTISLSLYAQTTTNSDNKDIIIIKPYQTIEIALPGVGWRINENSTNNQLHFINAIYLQNKEIFRFRATDDGVYPLFFQKKQIKNNMNNPIVTNKHITLYTEKNYVQKLALQQKQKARQASTLKKQEQNKKARLQTQKEHQQQYEAAIRDTIKNDDSITITPNTLTPSAISNQSDTQDMSLSELPLDSVDVIGLIKKIRPLEKTSITQARDKYEALITQYTKNKNVDEAYYRLANIYEKSSPIQNIQRAYELYNKVLQYFPLSLFWDQAKKRVNYLKQFFFFF